MLPPEASAPKYSTSLKKLARSKECLFPGRFSAWSNMCDCVRSFTCKHSKTKLERLEGQAFKTHQLIVDDKKLNDIDNSITFIDVAVDYLEKAAERKKNKMTRSNNLVKVGEQSKF